jgi:hypothetical protein
VARTVFLFCVLVTRPEQKHLNHKQNKNQTLCRLELCLPKQKVTVSKDNHHCVIFYAYQNTCNECQ